jgi:RNA polymerase sigma factor (sigma-70 family)
MEDHSDRTDRELWERGCSGDAPAFGVLFDRHADVVHNHLRRRMESPADAEDLTSAVFLHAWRRRNEVVVDRESVLPWLLAVANYVVANQRRALGRYRSALARLAPEPDTPDHAEAVADRLDDAAALARLRAAVQDLAPHERDVVELCVWSGLDQQAAAVALGITVGTVKSRLSRARQRLGRRLSGPAAPHPSSVHPSSVHPSSVHPSSVQPSSVQPSSVHPSRVHPSSVHPSIRHSDLGAS